jgi:hypothetical protein
MAVIFSMRQDSSAEAAGSAKGASLSAIQGTFRRLRFP